MEKRKFLKGSRGITLIALVITIIVLIILAGVSISLIIDQDGIIANAQKAKEKTRASQIKEAVELASITNALETDANKKTKASIIEELKAKGQLTTEEEAQLVESDTITIGGIEIDFSILESNNTEDNTTEVAIPTLSDTNKTYTGAEQTPTISGYNSEYVTQTGDAAATDVGTYTIKWSLKDTTNSKWTDGTTEEKSATWTISNPTFASQITAANYGDSVAYSVTVNGVTLNKWKIFYKDETTNEVIMIYNDYLPNSTGIAAGAGLITGGDYVVYSNTDRADLINKLNDTSKWISLIRSDLAGKATAKGALDLETWVASWNAKEYTRLYTAKNNGMSDSIGWGYYIATIENPTSYDQYVSGDEGYNDKLYFPYKKTQSNCSGYYLASPSAYYTSNVMYVYYGGRVSHDNYCGYLGVRPAVYLTSDILTSGKDASGNWIIE